MKKLIFCALIFLSFLSTIPVSTASEDIALTLVTKYRMGENLAAIGFQAATQTQTYKMMVDEVGVQKAQSIVKIEINKITPQYQSQWNKNLASAYTQALSSEKLRSLVNEGTSSKYSNDLKAKQKEIGTLMQSKSSGLLTEMLGKVMASSFSQIIKK